MRIGTLVTLAHNTTLHAMYRDLLMKVPPPPPTEETSSSHGRYINPTRRYTSLTKEVIAIKCKARHKQNLTVRYLLVKDAHHATNEDNSSYHVEYLPFQWKAPPPTRVGTSGMKDIIKRKFKARHN